MPRPAKFDSATQATIRGENLNNKELAAKYQCAVATISKIRNRQGAYSQLVLDLGTPILDSHARIVGVVEHNDH